MDFSAYADWQEALEDAFFSEEWDGHPVVFYVDDLEAEALRTKFGISVPLTEAVRQVVHPGSSKPYRAVEEYAHERRNGTDAPAVLPLLACSVIAATRMANDGHRRASNYHGRFSELLAGKEDVLTSALYPSVAAMWQRLASWQVQWGSYRGICTIPSPGELPQNQARIGYALSQAMLRGTDRRLLPQYFDIMRRRSEAAWPLPGAVLVQGVKLWDNSAKFSQSFQSALCEPDLQPLIARLLGALANTWDGSDQYVPQGTPRGELLVRFECRRLGWLARFPRPGAEQYQMQDGVVLRRIGTTVCYSVDGLALPTDRSLRTGIQLRGEGVAVGRPASSLLLLRQDAVLDCRMSVDRFAPGEEHMILAAPDAARDVERVLERAASPGRSKEAGRLGWMPDGWTLHNRVVFDDAVALREAILETEGAVLGAQPAPQFKAYLEGGLRLAPGISKHLYLTGGEPDLVLPDGTSQAALLDGDAQEPPLVPRGKPIPLWSYGLGLGSHTVQAEDGQLAFATGDSAPGEVEASASVGFPIEDDRAGAFATESGCGGLLRGAGTGTTAGLENRRVLLCRRGAEETLFVSSDGRAWRVAVPDTPAWWERLPEPPLGFRFEVQVPECGGWVLQLSRGAWRVEASLPMRPALRRGEDWRPWARVVLAAAGSGSGVEWDECVSLAREVMR
ncbi:hypothetical protein [Streptomyces vinaceus]|uniref:hypothetical protein n=1 Tax=Streptomyces vinaceus TaxID=1960 RepID=UPI0036BC1B4A